MASFPIRRAQEAHLTAHEIEVFQDRSDGLSWRKVAKKWATSLFVLGKWIKATPERAAAWKALDEIAAEARASDASDILEDAAEEARYGMMSPELTRLAIARSDLAKWEAAVMARGRFGESKGAANITVNVGGLHLTAVRETPPPAPAALIGNGETDEADYEIVDDEPSLEELLHG